MADAVDYVYEDDAPEAEADEDEYDDDEAEYEDDYDEDEDEPTDRPPSRSRREPADDDLPSRPSRSRAPLKA